MAELHFQKTNMSNDHLANRGSDKRTATRGWKCPSEESLASYLDGTMKQASIARIESHLGGCEYCCGVVGDVVKMQRSEAPEVPASLLRRSIVENSAKAKRGFWVVGSLAAASAIAIALVIAIPIIRMNPVLDPSLNTPSAPMVAKSEPLPAEHNRAPKSDEVRSSAVVENVPVLVFPEREKVVARDLLKFEWKPVIRARYYKIEVVTPDGDLLWATQAETAMAQFPRDLKVDDGPYFVMVSAYLDDGSIRRSAPVRFLVSTSR